MLNYDLDVKLFIGWAGGFRHIARLVLIRKIYETSC